MLFRSRRSVADAERFAQHNGMPLNWRRKRQAAAAEVGPPAAPAAALAPSGKEARPTHTPPFTPPEPTTQRERSAGSSSTTMASAVVSLKRQFPRQSVASLERALNYSGGLGTAAARVVSAVEDDDEDRCRPDVYSSTPAGGCISDAKWVPDFIPATDEISSLPSRQYQMGTERNYFDELQQGVDRAIQAAQNRKAAGRMRDRPTSAAYARPWNARPSGATNKDVAPPVWRDSSEPCVLCQRVSKRGAQLLTTEADGLCEACYAYFISLGAGDRPDLAWLRWERDGVRPPTPEPEPEPKPAAVMPRRRVSDAAKANGRWRKGGVAAAAARRHQMAIEESRRMREETGQMVGGGRAARAAKPRASSVTTPPLSSRTQGEVAKFRARVAAEAPDAEMPARRKVSAVKTKAPGRSASAAPSTGGDPRSPNGSPRRAVRSQRRQANAAVAEMRADLEQEIVRSPSKPVDPAVWHAFQAIVSESGLGIVGGSLSPPRSARSCATVLTADAIRSHLVREGHADFAATKQAVSHFISSPVRSPKAKAKAGEASVTFAVFAAGYDGWIAARDAHRNRLHRVAQDGVLREEVRTRETLTRRIDKLVFGLHENEQKQRASSRAAAGQQRISVAVGLRRLVGAISLAAFTDGLASAGGDAASKVPAMDGTMMGEVARTASKIGHDIGDGISVPNGVRRCPNPALPKTLC